MISIHALRVEGDFLLYNPRHILHISIHALRVEGDLGHIVLVDGFGKLLLSTPSGWRATDGIPYLRFWCQFLSTPSGWRATTQVLFLCCGLVISIHALRVEGDVGFTVFRLSLKISIHALRVEGDPLSLCIIDGYKISIHALRVEGDHILHDVHLHIQ